MTPAHQINQLAAMALDLMPMRQTSTERNDFARYSILESRQSVI
jgi:hypothetical protein